MSRYMLLNVGEETRLGDEIWHSLASRWCPLHSAEPRTECLVQLGAAPIRRLVVDAPSASPEPSERAVEAAARAMHANARIGPWDDFGASMHETYLDDARIALRAAYAAERGRHAAIDQAMREGEK